ncbi:hypothetical protein [Janthinobacterium sp. NKUCC08_JDC]|uniref:hypothetical protein n=1 Tax=Janthinobacterium sp. NKUCC08_JDC TaxID=2842122 RepID=UPI001C5B2836|nr:hypothetical protein [Janthinobacterium sp. NKUCC08_JDC]MBW3498890.1 hypothetical protein [Janthinobacterium sp. NKUCC08_JDC]
MRIFDVFTPGKTPTYTFVNDHLLEKKQAFEDALEQGGMLLNISGPSKSGKTVFVKNIIGAGNLISVSGAGILSTDELWLRVFHVAGISIDSSEVNEQNRTETLGGSAKITGSIAVVKGEGAINVSGTTGSKSSSTTKEAIDYLQLLIKELKDTKFVIFVDDFHYIARETQDDVARQIKEAIDKGVKFVCASVPHHSEDVLRANADLRGRIVNIDFDYWPVSSLRKIPERGFKELNLKADSRTLDALVSEVAGSPQLMQTLCLNVCLELNIREQVAQPTDIPVSVDFYSNACVRTAVTTDYSSTLEKLQDGPKTRGTERIQYRLTDGEVGDVYTILLQAIALDPPNLHFRYAELLDRIKTVCENDTPVGSSVTGACLHIAQLANDGQTRAIMAWDAAEDILDIRDPYLLFYIRWNKSKN